MKLKFYAITFAIFSTISCSKSDDTSGELLEKCATISNFSISQNIEKLNYKIQATGNPVAYQISFQNDLSETTKPEDGVIIDLEKNSGAIDLENSIVDLGYTYKIHVRAICSDGKMSDWFTPKTLYLKTYCHRPQDINLEAYSMSWTDWNENQTSHYQVQYGIKGFSLGSGTIIDTSDSVLSFSDIAMQNQKAYDFYIRTYCSEGKGWSSWTGPYSHYNTVN